MEAKQSEVNESEHCIIYFQTVISVFLGKSVWKILIINVLMLLPYELRSLRFVDPSYFKPMLQLVRLMLLWKLSKKSTETCERSRFCWHWQVSSMFICIHAWHWQVSAISICIRALLLRTDVSMVPIQSDVASFLYCSIHYLYNTASGYTAARVKHYLAGIHAFIHTEFLFSCLFPRRIKNPVLKV